MSLRNRLRTLFVCLVLEFGALTGLTMRPEEIKELMDLLNKPKVAQTNPDECAKGNDSET